MCLGSNFTPGTKFGFHFLLLNNVEPEVRCVKTTTAVYLSRLGENSLSPLRGVLASSLQLGLEDPRWSC